MNFFNKYMGSTAFTHAPEGVGGGAPASAPTADSSSEGGAPASSPSPSEAGSADSGDQTDSDFGGFSGEYDDDLDQIDLGTGTDPSPAPAATPAAPAAVPAAPATPAAPQVPTPPAAPAAAASPKEQSAPVPSDLDSMLTNMEANGPQLQEWLATNAFALSKEEAEAFELDAVGNVPKLMARVAVNNMRSTANLIKNIVPKLIAAEIEKHSATQSKTKEAIGEFYSTNPHLNEKDHGALVTKWANAFRAANPRASRKEAIEYVGRAVSFEAGVNPGAAPSQAAPRAAAFAPARPGARQPVATAAEQTNPFSGLGGDFDE